MNDQIWKGDTIFPVQVRRGQKIQMYNYHEKKYKCLTGYVWETHFRSLAAYFIEHSPEP
jgi:hypothetical protein